MCYITLLSEADERDNMTVQVIDATDKAVWLSERVKDLTSTDMAALFNCSPYKTPFELWHQKRDGTIIEIEENERMYWGNELEAPIAYGIAKKEGWSIKPLKVYMRLPQHRIGSSFDFAIDEDGLLEVKMVDYLAYRDGWIGEGEEIEAPPHIELQAQTELLVSGRKYLYLGVLVGGNKRFLFRREPDLEVHEAIKAKSAAFWKSIDKNQAPEPDYTRDADFINRLCGFAEPGKIYDATADSVIDSLVSRYKEASDREKKAGEEKDAIKAEILMKIGDAEKVQGKAWTISVGLVGPCHVEFDRKGYRNFRPSFKKGVTL